MPYEVIISVKADSQLEGVKTADEAIKRLTEAFGESSKVAKDAAQRSSEALDRHQKSALNLHKVILPLTAGISAMTSVIQTQNPALGAAVNAVDNFALGAVAAGAATGGWQGAMAALSGLLNPWVALVIAAGTALAYFSSRAAASREALESWSRSLEGIRGNLALLNASTEQQRIAVRVGKEHAAAVEQLSADFNAGKISAAEYQQRTASLTVAFDALLTAETRLHTEELARQNNLARSQAIAAGPLNDVQRINLDLQTKIRDISLQRIAPEEKSAQIANAQHEAKNRILSIDQALSESLLQQLESIRAETKGIEEGAIAQADYQHAVELAALARKSGRTELTKEQDQLNQAILAERERLEILKAQEQQRAALAKFIAESGAALDAQRQNENSLLEKELQLKQQLGDFELQKLRAAGAPEEAVLRRQIELLRAQQEALEASPIAKDPGQITAIKQQIDLAQIELTKLQNHSIDVAGEVARVVTDITSAIVNGTLKWADIGKSVLASFVRVALEQFTGFLRQMQQAAQANQLLGAGAIVPAGAVGALPGAQIGGPGGGGGGFFGGIGNFISSYLPSGVSFGGLAAAGAGGFGLSSLLGGSGLQHGLSTIGSIGGTLLGATGIGESILTGVFDLLTGGGTSALGFGGAAAAGVVGDLLGNFLLPGIGSIIGFLLGGLFQQIPNPSVWVKTVIKFYYDALTTSFNAFTQATILKFKDISGGKAQQVLADHQKIMDEVAKRFTDILNTFPVAVHDQIVPFLDYANERLAVMFGSKKYSEGGSRDISQELKDLREKEAPAYFFAALRPAIAAGINASLNLAGINLTDLVNSAFPLIPGLRQDDVVKNTGGGLAVPKKAADVQPFLDAVQKFASFTGSLAGISARGVTPFLTDADQARLQAELQKVLQARGTDFTKAVDDLLERVQPLSDFLKQAVTQSTDLFGRGLVAALDAASQSQAARTFLQTIGEGTKQILFQGIAEAFIASAQYTDLLAPIQKTIREFTQEAISTGQPPDLDAFRRALLPGIEDIATRTETLKPLIEELQKPGLNIKDALGLITGNAGSITININIDQFTGTEEDTRTLARRLNDMLSGQLPPP